MKESEVNHHDCYNVYRFLLLLIKNAIKNSFTAVVSLYMVNLKNPENQNAEIAANTSEAGTLTKLLISVCILLTMLP